MRRATTCSSPSRRYLARRVNATCPVVGVGRVRAVAASAQLAPRSAGKPRAAGQVAEAYPAAQPPGTLHVNCCWVYPAAAASATARTGHPSMSMWALPCPGIRPTYVPGCLRRHTRALSTTDAMVRCNQLAGHFEIIPSDSNALPRTEVEVSAPTPIHMY